MADDLPSYGKAMDELDLDSSSNSVAPAPTGTYNGPPAPTEAYGSTPTDTGYPTKGSFDNEAPPTYVSAVPGGHEILSAPHQQLGYDNPGYGNPGYGNLGYATQTHTMAVVQQPRQVVVAPYTYAAPMPNVAAPMVYSCIVLFFCCPLLGLIAFIISCTASCDISPQTAYSKIHMSNVISTIGVVIGFICYLTIIILVAVSD